jgi:hypothetical protein
MSKILTVETDLIDAIKENENQVQSLNRVKIQDAEIGSAQIDTLSADQITTGTLDVDTRILVNDGDDDRVLIGKF